jgi:hypothetical protein
MPDAAKGAPLMNDVQEVGQSRFVIWSMSYDWEPDGDPNGHPVRFERANPLKPEYTTLEEGMAALAKLTADDENWSSDSDFSEGGVTIYWLWRETVMASREVEMEAGYKPRRKRDEWGHPLSPQRLVIDADLDNNGEA